MTAYGGVTVWLHSFPIVAVAGWWPHIRAHSLTASQPHSPQPHSLTAHSPQPTAHSLTAPHKKTEAHLNVCSKLLPTLARWLFRFQFFTKIFTTERVWSAAEFLCLTSVLSRGRRNVNSKALLIPQEILRAKNVINTKHSLNNFSSAVLFHLLISLKNVYANFLLTLFAF